MSVYDFKDVRVARGLWLVIGLLVGFLFGLGVHP